MSQVKKVFKEDNHFKEWKIFNINQTKTTMMYFLQESCREFTYRTCDACRYPNFL